MEAAERTHSPIDPASVAAPTQTAQQAGVEPLRESAELFRAVLETSPDGFMVFRSVHEPSGAIADFEWLFVNAVAARIVRRSAAELVGRRLLIEMPGNGSDGLFDTYRRVVESGEVWQGEFRYAHENLDAWLRATAAKVGDGFAVCFTEITERKRTEAALAEEQVRMRLALKASGAATWVIDYTRGGVERFDPRARELAGLDPERSEWPPGAFCGLLHPEDRALMRVAQAAAFEHGESSLSEYRIVRPDGALRWLQGAGIVERDGSGVPRCFIGVSVDVTDRKLAEERQRESAERLRLALAASRAGVWELELATRTAYWSAETALLHGLPPRECTILESTWLRSVYPEELPLVHQAIAKVLSDRQAEFQIEYRVRHPERGEIWLLAIGRMQNVAAHGRAERLSGIILDITERKHSEQHRELLMHEFGHRMKNTLSIVQSIAAQTRRSAQSLEQFHEAFAARLRALARAHDLIVGEGWEALEVQRLLEQVLSPYRSADCSRVVLAGPSVRIEAETAVSLAMAVYELATNATKYGALSRTSGEVSLRWELCEDAVPAAMKLLWQECGGPVVAQPSRHGFGSQLLNSLARQFHAPVALSFLPEGLECRLRIPCVAERK